MPAQFDPGQPRQKVRMAALSFALGGFALGVFAGKLLSASPAPSQRKEPHVLFLCNAASIIAGDRVGIELQVRRQVREAQKAEDRSAYIGPRSTRTVSVPDIDRIVEHYMSRRLDADALRKNEISTKMLDNAKCTMYWNVSETGLQAIRNAFASTALGNGISSYPQIDGEPKFNQ